MMRTRFHQPPKALRRSGIRLDNVALVPARLLSERERWQDLANQLPRGGVLIVLPSTNARQRQFLKGVARRLAANGHRVATVTSDQFTKRTSRTEQLTLFS